MLHTHIVERFTIIYYRKFEEKTQTALRGNFRVQKALHFEMRNQCSPFMQLCKRIFNATMQNATFANCARHSIAAFVERR
jgi:hypothetical protein